MNSFPVWRFKWLNSVLYVLMALFLVSCSSVGGRSPASTDNGTPSAHAWQYLYSYGDEGAGYATYSYVLVGRDHNNQKTMSLYYELVKAIKVSGVSAESLLGHVPSGSLNLFIIPVTSRSGAGDEEPNYQLSKMLLAVLSATSPLKFSRPGSYIITLYLPIGAGGDDKVADILYVDLTGAHPKAIPEIVRTYSEAVIDKKLSGVENLNSLRLSLLNMALHTEDSIGFAKSAYASMRGSFAE